MPVVQIQKKPKWPRYVLFGCLGFILLITAVYIGITIFLIKALSSLSTSTPRKHTTPYVYYATGAAECRIALPDGSGSIVYMHKLGNGGGMTPDEGERAVRFLLAGGKPDECPLPYFSIRDVRVGVYWYPAQGTAGSYIRMNDSCSEVLVDPQKRITYKIIKAGNRAFIGRYYRDYESYQTSGPPQLSVTYNGKPAQEVTKQLASNKRKYIGSIIRVGSNLKFVPAQTGKR